MSRTNMNVNFFTTGVKQTRTWNQNNQGTPLYTTSNARSGQVIQTRVSNVQPSYYVTRSNGPLLDLSFSYTSDISMYTAGFVFKVTPQYIRSEDRGVMGLVAPNLPDRLGLLNAARETNMTNSVKQKLLSKIKNQDINLAQFYAERAQTSRLLADTVSSIGKAYSSLKKGDFAGAARHLGIKPPSSKGFNATWSKNQSKAIAQGWLSLQYGWRPLIQDAYGLVKHLDDVFNSKKLEYQKVSAREIFTDSPFDVVRDGNRTTTTQGEVTMEVSGRILYRKSSGARSELSSLGITNPLYLAYELTKFSFVVDWFVHIGNFLSALDATLGYAFYTGSITIYRRQRVSIRTTCIGPHQGYILWHERTEASREYVLVTRQTMSSFPQMSAPVFRDPASLEHFLNALALFKTLKR